MSYNPTKTLKLESITRIRAGLSSRDIQNLFPLDDEIPLKMISSSSLTGPFLSQIQGEKITMSASSTTSRHLLEQYDIITTSRGSFRVSILEKSPEVMSEGYQLVAGPMCMVVRVNDDMRNEISAAYLALILSTPAIASKITSSARGSAALIFSRDSLASLEIPVPPFAEQLKIAQVARHATQLYDARRAEATLEYSVTIEELNQIVGLR